MKTKKQRIIKNTFSYLLAFTLFICANFGLISVLMPDYVSYAANTTNPNEITISNSNFDSNTSNNYPFSPDNFTPSLDEDNAGVEAGVINLEADDYKDIYTQNPMSDDPYVLMIKSENAGSDFSYTTDEAVTLNKSSNYMFTVDVYTDNNNGIVNLYLMQDDIIYTSMTDLSSQNGWTTYHFFISTNDVDDFSLNLRLNAKNVGVALFDNISCFELNDSELATRMKIDASLYNYVDESEKYETSTIDLSQNGVFSNFSSGNGQIADGTAQDAIAFDGSVNRAFKIKNETATYSKYETADDFITIEQNKIYKITLMVKTRNLSGNANLQLVETNLEEGVEGNDLTTISITSNTSSTLYNDYQEYSFYIFGYADRDTTYKLIVGLGDADDETMTSGELYLTTAKISNVTYSIFNDVSTGSGNEKLNLNALTTSSTDIYLTNGQFFQFETTDLENPYPATPSSWTVTAGTGEQKYGVVNTSIDEWNEFSSKNQLSNLSNPNPNNENNNVLMMYNAGNDTLSYTSATTSSALSAKTYHRFSVRVQTQNAPATISLVTTNDSSEVTLSSITVDTNYTWQTVELYLYTGFSEITPALKITLDSDAWAYCYVDDATFDYFGQPTADEFSELTNSNTRVVTDLTDLLASNSTSNWANANFISTSNDGNVRYGISNLNNSNLRQEVVQNEQDYVRFISLDSENKNVFGIRAYEDTNFTAATLVGYKLTGGSYYRLSVSVFTKNLQILNEENMPEADENGNIHFGAGLSLTGFDNSFTNIVSDGDWTTYTFYINPTDDTTTYLQFSLGSALTPVTGDVFFGGIEFVDEGIDTVFDSVVEDGHTLKLQTTTETTDEEESDTSEDANNNGSVNWLYILPSLVFALAIVIAVVGILVRKVKWKKPTRKSKTEYDRNRTVSKQIYERKATTIREEKLNELNKELFTLTEERTKYEENYKRDINKLRDMKIKRASQSEINKLNKDMKKDQKLAANLGVSISRIESEIEFVKSDGYIKSLIRKLERESIVQQNQPEVENAEEKVVTTKTSKANKSKSKKVDNDNN
ncbi:MAG TPA: hypothetical protein IAB72_04230 [Candidatus Onthoplasma faecipullorum]|nr:hypothetical protein [Candidatus Onthoplasma faecipullorum]